MYHIAKILCLSIAVMTMTACEDKSKILEKQEQLEQALSPLNIKIQAANFATPFCEKKDCLSLSIQSIVTQNDYVNQWIERSQSNVIQQQIDLKKDLPLQQAVDAYVKRSDAWQAEKDGNKAFNLQMATRIAAQRQQYVLLQLMVHSQQGDTSVDNQSYYFVYDRKQNKTVRLLEILKDDHQHKLHEIIQAYYQEWLAKQNNDVKKQAPDVLYWGQSDWFFDQDGIGLHYRQGQISPKAPILDIYLTPEQGQAMVQSEIYRILFP